jgi:hypothetical protein
MLEFLEDNHPLNHHDSTGYGQKSIFSSISGSSDHNFRLPGAQSKAQLSYVILNGEARVPGE